MLIYQLWRIYSAIHSVRVTVLADIRQVVTVVDHESQWSLHSSWAGVTQPVESPYRSTILQVKVSHWIQGITSTLLLSQVSEREKNSLILKSEKWCFYTKYCTCEPWYMYIHLLFWSKKPLKRQTLHKHTIPCTEWEQRLLDGIS